MSKLTSTYQPNTHTGGRRSIQDKQKWSEEQELHQASQKHAEWAAKQMLERLKALRESFGHKEGTENFKYLMPLFQKRYKVKADHWSYAQQLINKQLEVKE